MRGVGNDTHTTLARLAWVGKMDVLLRGERGPAGAMLAARAQALRRSPSRMYVPRGVDAALT